MGGIAERQEADEGKRRGSDGMHKCPFFIINKLMLSGQNYRQFIAEQGEIERSIAEGWGYELNAKEHLPRREKLACNLKVAAIHPLRQIFDLPVSKKLEQVEEELLMLQNERKLNELTEKALQSTRRGESESAEEAAAIKMMRQCVQQYNFIIDHRHIAEKNTEKARKILGIQKSESKELFEQIHSLKGQMGQSTLANTIKINSEIARLYKKYSSIVPKSSNCSDRATTKHEHSSANRALTSPNTSTCLATSKLSPNRRTALKNGSEKSEFPESQTKKESLIELKDIVIMQELNESEEGQSLPSSRLEEEEPPYQPQSLLIHHAIAKMQRRVSEYAPPRRRCVPVLDARQREREERKQRMATTMEEAYVAKEVLHKGKRLDKMIQEHHEVIDVWRQRITENLEKNKSFHLKFHPKDRAKKFKSVNHTRRVESEKAEEAPRAPKAHYRAEEMQQDLAEKERILSVILSKKESKFKRIPGTQILQKNDVNSTAKIFLGISKHPGHSPPPPQPCLSNQGAVELPEWENLEAEDERLYWSRCKNEKLNLLLKSRKVE